MPLDALNGGRGPSRTPATSSFPFLSFLLLILILRRHRHHHNHNNHHHHLGDRRVSNEITHLMICRSCKNKKRKRRKFAILLLLCPLVVYLPKSISAIDSEVLTSLSSLLRTQELRGFIKINENTIRATTSNSSWEHRYGGIDELDRDGQDRPIDP